MDAIRSERTTLHPIPPDEFAVEAFIQKERLMFTGIVEELGVVEPMTGSHVSCSLVLIGSHARSQHSCQRSLPDCRRHPRRRLFRRPRPGNPASHQPWGPETRRPGQSRTAGNPATRLSGHIVQGHVDGVGILESFENYVLRVQVPQDLDRFLVYKGSIAIDGISLTIAEVNDGLIRVAIIPHTWGATNLQNRKPDDRSQYRM